LRQSGLTAGKQFGLLVVGLDPKDDAAAAANQRRDHLGDDPALNAATRFVTADASTVRSLTDALGYRYRYDAADDQYLHPAAAYVLRADGAVSRVLTSIGLSGGDLRLALVEAGDGQIGTTADRIRLLCSHFDPARGSYDLVVSRLMMGTGAATLAVLALLLGGLMLADRRQPFRRPPR
jgi:protein SCO1/2